MTAYDSRHAMGGARDARRFSRLSVTMLSCAMLLIGLSIAMSRGAIAAAPSPAGAPAETAMAEPENAAAPINLAGRWTGPRHGIGARAGQQDCGPGLCALTYDIVACGSDWCGIAVARDETCGAVAMKLTRSAEVQPANSFRGKLELAKGSDPYVIEAWYSGPGGGAGGDGEKPHLSLIGDTGPELMMFRRSFPFSAELARSGDGKCTLEKATS